MTDADDADDAPPTGPEPGRGWRLARRAALLLLLATLASAPWWGRLALARMSFFAVKRVEVVGARYLPPSQVLARLRLDTTASVWDDHSDLVRRLERHPQVLRAEIGRKLPRTLVVRVTERRPIALVASREGFRPVDEEGRVLPVDPTRTDVDLPILASRDSGLLAVLARVRAVHPAMFAALSEVRRAGPGEIVLQMATVPVRAMADVSAERLAELIPVEADLSRRRASVAELDLRYRDQVIVRLQ